MLRLIAPSGINILKTYFNPEAERPDNTEWRKPGPKMLLEAANDFKLDISKTYMIGDSESDIQAAINVGCRGGIYLKTTNPDTGSKYAIYNTSYLLDAVKIVVSNNASIDA